MDKIQKTEQLIRRLKATAEGAIHKQNYERALTALAACANVLYEYNQRYKDDEIEEMLLIIGSKVVSVPDDFKPKTIKPVQTVLFYDGFGLDLRGLAIYYVTMIAALGYRLIYVTDKKAENNQPHIRQEMEGCQVEYVYINMDKGYRSWAEELRQIFLKYSPQVAYYYTTPYDVSGTIVFNQMKDHVVRLLINLTDHAFWIGLNAFDFCGASRPMGTWINLHGRGIPIEKMYNLRSTIYISKKTKLGPLPFDTKKFRYVFGGGALYKTLGDPDLYYYRMIDHIVSNHSDVNFLYAGDGDTSEFDKLINKYPGRVFLIPEREDFFQIIQGAVFYLNTYPMFGGQMMRYSAYAGKLPVTLKHNNDGEGILFHQNELEIEFESYEDVVYEIDRLLTDEEYRRRKESRLERAVLPIEEVRGYYRQMIETQVSPIPVVLEEFDTSKFQQEYINRLDYRRLKETCIAKKRNSNLIPVFPLVFARKAIHKLVKR